MAASDGIKPPRSQSNRTRRTLEPLCMA